MDLTRFEDLLSRYSDGRATAREMAELEALLKADPACRREFVERMRLDVGLSTLFESASGKELVRPSRRREQVAFASIAAAVLVSVVLYAALRPEPLPPPVAPREPATAHAPSEAVAEKIRAESDRKKAEERVAELHVQEQAVAKGQERRPVEDEEALKRAQEELRKIQEEREAAEAGLREARERERRAAEALARSPEQPPRKPETTPPAMTQAPVARVDRAEGDVYVANKSGRLNAKAGLELRAGEGVETVGPRSLIVLSFPDRSRLEVAENSRVRGLFDTEQGTGKRVVLERGALKAEIARQPEGRPLVIATPHGDAKVMGTTFRIQTDADPKKGTHLEVEQGKVELRNLAGKTVMVETGHQAVAATGVLLTSRPLPREETVLFFDFEDGKTPAVVEKGVVERGPGNRMCLSGVSDKEGGCRLMITDGLNGLFTFQGDEVFSFDYWVDPGAGGVNFSFYNRTQKRNHDWLVPRLVLGKWTHVTVSVADLGGFNEHPAPSDWIVQLYMQGTGGAGMTRRFYVDNLQITRVRMLRPKEAKR